VVAFWKMVLVAGTEMIPVVTSTKSASEAKDRTVGIDTAKRTVERDKVGSDGDVNEGGREEGSEPSKRASSMFSFC